MTRARTFAALGAALIAFGLAAWVVPEAQAQSSAPALATGWWTRQPGEQPIPADGFKVSWALEQEQAMAAVRMDTSVAAGGTVYLVLKEVGGNATDQGFVDLCRTTTNAWTAANPGAYADRPASDCTGSSVVRLGRDSTSKEWVGDISALANPAGTVSLALRPAGKPLSAGSPASAPFSVNFGSAELRYDPPATTTTLLGGTAPPETFVFDGGGAGTQPIYTYPGSSSGGLDTPGLDTVVVVPTDAPAEVTTTIGGGIVHGPVNGLERGPRPWGRVAVLTPISAGIGSLAAAGRRWKLDRA